MGFFIGLLNWFYVKSINVTHHIKRKKEDKRDNFNGYRKRIGQLHHAFIVRTLSTLGIEGDIFNLIMKTGCFPLRQYMARMSRVKICIPHCTECLIQCNKV